MNQAMQKLAADFEQTYLTNKVYRILKNDYPEDCLCWVKDATWTLRKSVPLSQIKMARRPGGARETDKTKRIAEAIQGGKKMDPIFLVDIGDGQYKIADGYHRTKGMEMAGKKTISAYVAKVNDKNGPWDKEMHEKKLNKGPQAKAADQKKEEQKMLTKQAALVASGDFQRDQAKMQQYGNWILDTEDKMREAHQNEYNLDGTKAGLLAGGLGAGGLLGGAAGLIGTETLANKLQAGGHGRLGRLAELAQLPSTILGVGTGGIAGAAGGYLAGQKFIDPIVEKNNPGYELRQQTLNNDVDHMYDQILPLIQANPDAWDQIVAQQERSGLLRSGDLIS